MIGKLDSSGVRGDLSARIGVNRRACRRVHEHKARDAAHVEDLGELGLARVAVWDGQPRHGGKVLLEGLGITVRADEDDLKVLRLEVLGVALDQLRRERPARRAPVRTEVQPDHLALAFELFHLHGLAIGSLEEGVAESLPKGWRLPREVDTGRIFGHSLAAVLCDHLAGGAIQDYQCGDARHLEAL